MTVAGARGAVKKRDQSGGSRSLSRRRSGERITGIVPAPGPPLLRKQRNGRRENRKERERGWGAAWPRLILNSALIMPTRVSLAPGRLTRRRAAA